MSGWVSEAANKQWVSERASQVSSQSVSHLVSTAENKSAQHGHGKALYCNPVNTKSYGTAAYSKASRDLPNGIAQALTWAWR